MTSMAVGTVVQSRIVPVLLLGSWALGVGANAYCGLARDVASDDAQSVSLIQSSIGAAYPTRAYALDENSILRPRADVVSQGPQQAQLGSSPRDEKALESFEALGAAYDAIQRNLLAQHKALHMEQLPHSSPRGRVAKPQGSAGQQKRPHRVVVKTNADVNTLLRPDELREAAELKREVRQLRSRLIQYMAVKPNKTSTNQTPINETDPVQAMLSRMEAKLNDEDDFMGLSAYEDSPMLMYIFYACMITPFALAALAGIVSYSYYITDADGDGSNSFFDSIGGIVDGLTSVVATTTETTCNLLLPQWCYDFFCGCCNLRIICGLLLLADVSTGLGAWALYHDMLQPIAAQLCSYLYIMVVALALIFMVLYEVKEQVFSPIQTAINDITRINKKVNTKLESVVDGIESFLGVDLDGDGDVGQAGHKSGADGSTGEKKKRYKPKYCA